MHTAAMVKGGKTSDVQYPWVFHPKVSARTVCLGCAQPAEALARRPERTWPMPALLSVNYGAARA